MREELSEVEGKKLTFTGTCHHYGSVVKGKKVIKTILFKQITSEELSVDHMWFLAKHFPTLRIGTIVSWESRVKKYTKGYKGLDPDLLLNKPQLSDYKFTHPREIKIVGFDKEVYISYYKKVI